MRGLVIGRFQPFHRGHLAMVRAIRASHPEEELLLGIGSAQASDTPENPFTAGERFEMIQRALAEAGIRGCVPVPIPDVDRHAIWVAHVASLLPPFDRVYTNNPLTRRLFEAGKYQVEGTELFDRAELEGAKVRTLLREGGPWRGAVPPAVADYLTTLDAEARVRTAGPPGLPRPGRS